SGADSPTWCCTPARRAIRCRSRTSACWRCSGCARPTAPPCTPSGSPATTSASPPPWPRPPPARRTAGADVPPVGSPGPPLATAADVAAPALGAQYVERHFTLDRTSKGTDHAASLEPDGMRKLARDLRNVAKALTYKPSDVLPIEETQREKLKWRGGDDPPASP